MAHASSEEKSKLLLEWREANWAELDENLRIAKEIRDGAETKPADKLDAIRTIARMFGALGTLGASKPPKKFTEEKFTITEDEEQRLRGVLTERIKPS